MPLDIGGGIITGNFRNSEKDSMHWHNTTVFLDFGDYACYPESGTKAYNLMNTGLDIDIVGSPTWLRNPGCFDITSDSTYISFSTDKPLPISPRDTRIWSGTGGMGVSMWMKFDSLGTYDSLWEIGTWTDSILLRYQSGNSGVALFAEGSTIGTFPWSPSTNTWYHVCLVRRSTDNVFRLFINASELGTTFTNAVNVNPGQGDSVHLMRSVHTTGSQFTDGKIATWAFHRRNLTDYEVQREYDSYKHRFGYS